MLGAFLAQDLILFVLFFDLMLIPFYFLFGSWGTEHPGRPEEGEGPSSQVERPRRLQLVLPRLGERGLRPSQGGVGGTFEQRETASLLEDVGEVRR